MTETLTITLADFEGPLDLLCHLIRQSKMTIADLSVADVTRQYLAFLEAQDAIALNPASDYLVMAASLLRLKSKELLPAVVREDDDDSDIDDDVYDTREDFIAHLLAYEQLTYGRQILTEQQQRRQQLYARPATVATPAGPPRLAPGNAELLQAALQKYHQQRTAPPKRPEHLDQPQLTFQQATARLYRCLRQQPLGIPLPVAVVFDCYETRHERVMAVLGLLDLTKRQQLRLVPTTDTLTIVIRTHNYDQTSAS